MWGSYLHDKRFSDCAIFQGSFYCWLFLNDKVQVIKMNYSLTTHISCMPCNFYFFLNQEIIAHMVLVKWVFYVPHTSRKRGARGAFLPSPRGELGLSCLSKRSPEQLTSSHLCIARLLLACFRNMGKAQALMLSCKLDWSPSSLILPSRVVF